MAGKAVPAVALAGALVVAADAPASLAPARSAGVANPAIHARLDTPAQLARLAGADRPVRAALRERAALPVGEAVQERAAAAQHRLSSADLTYVVQPGDTLSGIAYRFYGQARAWLWLYQVNRGKIRHPNLIFPGQVLQVPREASGWLGSVQADADHVGLAADPPPAAGSVAASSQPVLNSALQGTLGCSGLEALWRSAGGSPSYEVTAASVAMAESSGIQYATGPFGERGYWQINPDHGALSTYDAYGNARAAVIISDDGTDWSAWTTYVDGAYLGQC
jgi:LysM repeat protein